MNEINKWSEIERIWKEEWEKEFPEDAKRLEESLQKDFEEMGEYGKDLEKLTEKFVEKLTKEFEEKMKYGIILNE